MYEEKFGGSRWSCSWLGQKVNIAIALALTDGDHFGPMRIRPNGNVSNGLAFTLSTSKGFQV